VNRRSGPWARAFISTAPGEKPISGFGLQLIAITKNQTFSKTSDLRPYGVHGKCFETGTRFLSRSKINEYCEVWMTTGFGTRF